MEPGKTTSEYLLTKIGIGAGLFLQSTQTFDQLLSETQTQKVMSLLTSNPSSTDVQQISTLLSTSRDTNPLGFIFTVLIICIYVCKRAFLKYLEFKGQLSLELAKIQVETELVKESYKKQLQELENKKQRTDS